MNRTSHAARAAAGVLTLGLLLAPLTGCAPEPGADGAGALGPGTSDPKDKKEPEGNSWPEENPDEVFEKNQDIPADFPEGFVIPEGAVIDDIGSHGYGTWFVVLRAADAATADALWEQIVETGSFAVSDEGETTEKGIVATLTSATLNVTAMTIPQPSGEVLVSYDIAATVG